MPTQQVELIKYRQMTLSSSSSPSSSSFSLSSSLAFQQNSLSSSLMTAKKKKKKPFIVTRSVSVFISVPAQHLMWENLMLNPGTKCTIQHESESLINTRKQKRWRSVWRPQTHFHFLITKPFRVLRCAKCQDVLLAPVYVKQ